MNLANPMVKHHETYMGAHPYPIFDDSVHDEYHLKKTWTKIAQGFPSLR